MPDVKIARLIEDQSVLDKLAYCLDREFRWIKYWKHWARELKVPSDIIQKCGINKQCSPTERLFEYLKYTKHKLTVGELRTALRRIDRNDICLLLDNTTNLTDGDNVAEKITSSASDILDNIALKLDFSHLTGLVSSSWFKLALKLGVSRDTCKRFEMYSNSARHLFEYLFSSMRDVTLADLILQLKAMEWNYLVEIIQEKKFEESAPLYKAISLESQLFDEISFCLNKDVSGLGGWRRLGGRLGVPSEVLDTIEPSLTNQSATKKMLDCLSKFCPETTIAKLVQGLKAIERLDAVEIIGQLGVHTVVGDLEEDLSGMALGPDLSESEDVLLETKDPITSTDVGSPTQAFRVSFTVVHEFPNNGQAAYGTQYGVAIPESVRPATHVSKSLPFPIPSRSDVREGAEAGASPLYGVEETEKSQEGSITQGTVIPTNLPTKPLYLVYRDKDKQRLLDEIASDQYVLEEVYAPVGYGKTSLVVTVARELMEQRRWSVLYVNCRHVKSVDDFAVKIIEEISKTDCIAARPTELALWAVENLEQNTLLIIENYDELLHLERSQKTADTSKILDPDFPCKVDHGSRISADVFVTRLAQIKSKSQTQFSILLTSKEKKDFVGFEQDKVELKEFEVQETVAFLMERAKKRNINLEEPSARYIAQKCCGIPLLIDIALTRLQDEGVKEFEQSLSSSPAEYMMNEFCPDSLTPEKRIDNCLRKCFERMDPEQQEIFVMMCVFPGPFSENDVAKVMPAPSSRSEYSRKKSLKSLTHQHCFIRKDNVTSMFFIRSVFRSFGMHMVTMKAGNLQKKYNSARENFIMHILSTLRELDSIFYSHQSATAITRFRQERPNIDEVLRLCIYDCDVEDITKEVLVEVIDVLLEIAVFLAKIIRRGEFERLFCKMYRLCIDDARRSSACLVFLGAKITISCLCEPPFCEKARKRAEKCLEKANEIQEKAKISEGNERALCLSKMGRCLARTSDERGFNLINQAFQLRRQIKPLTMKHRVLLAAAYNDLAAAESYSEDKDAHLRAIDIRIEDVIPVYEEVLGEHPFAASAYSCTAQNYLAINNLDKAIELNEKALCLRQTLLGEHPETAKSLFDVGATYFKKGELESAMQYLNQAQTMQLRVLDTPEELIKTHEKLQECYTRLGQDEQAREQKQKIESLKSKVHDYSIAIHDFANAGNV